MSVFIYPLITDPLAFFPSWPMSEHRSDVGVCPDLSSRSYLGTTLTAGSIKMTIFVLAKKCQKKAKHNKLKNQFGLTASFSSWINIFCVVKLSHVVPSCHSCPKLFHSLTNLYNILPIFLLLHSSFLWFAASFFTNFETNKANTRTAWASSRSKICIFFVYKKKERKKIKKYNFHQTIESQS